MKEWFYGRSADEAPARFTMPAALRWLLAVWLVVLGCLAYSCALAEGWVTVPLASYHLKRAGYCEANPGLGVELGRFVAGAYRNSACRGSVYAGAVVPLAAAEGWTLGAPLLAVTGYDNAVSPAGGLLLAYAPRRWGFNLVWFPNGKGHFDRGVVGLQAKRRW